jgi:hypothetical protein
VVWDSFSGPEFIEDDVCDTRDNEASKKVEIIDISRSNWDCASDSAGETDNIDYNAEDVGNLGSNEIVMRCT